MGTYVAIFEHTPRDCPGTSKEMFEFVGSQMAKLESTASEMGVTNIQIHALLPGHRGVAILDAEDFTAAKNFILEI